MGAARSAQIELLPLGIGPIWAAIHAECAVEILGRTPWIPVPSASELIPGVIAHRGRAVAVLDLGVVLPDLPRLTARSTRERVVISRTSLGLVALPVEKVHEVVSVPSAEVREATLTRGSPFEVTIDDKAMPLVDLETILEQRGLARPGAG